MTEQQVRFAREKFRLTLTRGDSFSHYTAVLYLLLPAISIAAFKLYHTLKGHPATYNNTEIIITVIMLLAAFAIYLFQKRRLNFSWIETNLSHGVIVKIINKVAVELNWSLQAVKDDYIVAMTKSPLLSESHGERVTIVFNGDKLLINILDVEYIWWSRSATDINYLFAAIEQEQYLLDYPAM